MRYGIGKSLALLTLSVPVFLLGCERPPIESVQQGYRGTGMVHVVNPRLLEDKLASIELPTALPQVPASGPTAGDSYENVQVLGDLSVAQFTRLMASMTQWVSPEQGCTYCHVPGNFASDDIYTKVVSRRMLQMTQHINNDWKDHVANTGVTCYTCHRGKPVPANIWFEVPEPRQARGMVGNRAGQNIASPAAAYASLPEDAFTPFLVEDNAIGVITQTALPSGNRKSIKQAEWTYSLMMHFSQSLGANCTYCHNSRSFKAWDQSSPARTTAWYGIRMVRDLNNDYLNPLQPEYPEYRLGPLGDAPKANCATCHEGAYKPLYGAKLLEGYPSLGGGGQQSEAEAERQPLADVQTERLMAAGEPAQGADSQQR
jgi:photosynthetic reaction center cytochrome c subunit